MPKEIQFEGTTHTFPDDFSDAEIQSALTQAHPAAAPAAPKESPGYLSEAAGGVERGLKSLLPPTAETPLEGMLGPISTVGRMAKGLGESAKAAYAGAMDPEGGAAGRVLRVAENIPLIGGVVKKAEEAGPGYAKMTPATVGAITEGITSAAAPFAAERIPAIAKAGAETLAKTRVPQEAAAADISQAHNTFAENIKKAIPPTNAHPYNVESLHRIADHLFDQHSVAPISGAADLVEATDSAIKRAATHVRNAISEVGPTRLNKNVLADVQRELGKSTVKGFATSGVKSLSEYGLDEPLTLDQADRIREQLNAENQGILDRNKYDVSTARKVDPGFAAREAAAKSLREGTYKGLAEQGYPGIDELRKSEGELLEFRDAAHAQRFAGDKSIPGTGKAGPLRTMAKLGSTAGGTALGYHLGGEPGAIAGSVVGQQLGRMFSPEALSRDEMIANAFPKIKMPMAELPGRQFTPTRELPAVPETPTLDIRISPMAKAFSGEEPLRPPVREAVPHTRTGETLRVGSYPRPPLREVPSEGPVAPEQSALQLAGVGRAAVSQLIPKVGSKLPGRASRIAVAPGLENPVTFPRDFPTTPVARAEKSTLLPPAAAAEGIIPRSKMGRSLGPTGHHVLSKPELPYGEVTGEPITIGGSGESSASQEAISRVGSEKMRGITRVRIDTRSGREIPLSGVDAPDATAKRGEVIVKRYPDGREEIQDTGVGARYMPKSRSKSRRR